MKICKTCGEVAHDDAKICAKCSGVEFVDASDRIVCPRCGLANPSDSVNCISCGEKLPTGTIVITAPEEDEEQAEAAEQNALAIRNQLAAQFDEKNSSKRRSEFARCPNCGAPLKLNSIFCTDCGTPVATVHSHRVLKRKICVYCGTPNSPTEKYCSYCFGDLENARMVDFQLSHETQTLGQHTVKRAFVENPSGKFKICNNCNSLNKWSDGFCVKCGLKLDVEKQSRYCVNCGEENDADAQFCTKCRWSFEGVSPQSMVGSWTCAKCGNINQSDAAFCVKCGTKKH